MSIMDNMNGSGMLFPIDAAMDDEESRRGEMGERRFLVGGPMGPLYPLGMFPVDSFDFDEEDEDPNP